MALHHVGVVAEAPISPVFVGGIAAHLVPLGILRAQPRRLIAHPVHVGGLFGRHVGSMILSGQSVRRADVDKIVLGPFQQLWHIRQKIRIPAWMLQKVQTHITRARGAPVASAIDSHVAVAVHPIAILHRISQKPVLERGAGTRRSLTRCLGYLSIRRSKSCKAPSQLAAYLDWFAPVCELIT